MRVLTTVPQDNLSKVPAAARAVEADGFTGIISMENRHDPFLPLAIAATETEHVELCTAVAIAFSRSPMVVANMGWDLNEASAGRFVLGLGSQVKAHNERRFSVPWTPPAPRLREYVEALRAIWRCWAEGERLAFEGDHYRFTLMTPNFVPESTGQRLPPITLAAVGPAMLKVAGEVADGVRLHPFCTRKYMESVVLPRLQVGWKRSGRARETFEITGGGFVATGANEEAVAKMREWVRYRVAFYGSTPAYYPVLEAHGLEDLGLELNRLSKEGRWNEMAGRVSDEVLELFAAVGTHDEIAARIEERFGGLSDSIYASMSSELASDMPREIVARIGQIPIKFAGYHTR